MADSEDKQPRLPTSSEEDEDEDEDEGSYEEEEEEDSDEDMEYSGEEEYDSDRMWGCNFGWASDGGGMDCPDTVNRLGPSWKFARDGRPLCRDCAVATEPHFLAHVLRGENAGATSRGPLQSAAPVWALEYQPGGMASGCQPRPSDVSFLCQPRGLQQHKLPLSFLPPKFQGFSGGDYVVQDRLVCIWKTEEGGDESEDDELACVNVDAHRVSFCVVDLLAKTCRELPVLDFSDPAEFKGARKDWTVKLVVVGHAGLSFRLALICPLEDPAGVVRRVTAIYSFSCETGAWEFTHIQGRYRAPNPDGDDFVQGPLFGFVGGFLYHAKASIAKLLKVNVDTGETVGNCGQPPREMKVDRPCRLVGSNLGIFCAAEHFHEDMSILRT